MTGQPPTLEQLRHLIKHVEDRRLTPQEAARLRAGVDHLAASQAGMAAKVDDLTRRLVAGTRPVIDIDCPTCPARARSRCVYPQGHQRQGFHRARIAAAALPEGVTP